MTIDAATLNAALKPCPHCGSPGEITSHRVGWKIGCSNINCLAFSNDLYFEDENMAVIDWNARATASPVDAVLFCPACKAQHIDAPEPENGWTNPPHKSHLCHACGAIWRPADVPTNGVRHAITRGEKDTLP